MRSSLQLFKQASITWSSLVALTPLFPCSSSGAEPEPATHLETRDLPNILFIILDDLNDSVEGFGGHPQAHTPHIDRLARQGVRFLNAACNSPICSPSRPSMLTGLYPFTTGYYFSLSVRDLGSGSTSEMWNLPVLQDSVTWVQYFKDHGYDVQVGGKVYHNHAERQSDLRDADGKRIYGPAPSWGPFPTPEHGPDPARHPNVPYVGPISWFARLSDVPPDGWSLYRRPFHYVSEEDRDLMPDELLAEWVIDFLTQRPDSADERPFFLNVGINRPHEPFLAPDPYFDLFPLATVERFPGIKEGDLKDCAPFLYMDFERNRKSHMYGFSRYERTMENNDLQRLTQAYLACVAFVDDMIGRMLSALENSPYADNTIVVVTSDNGYHVGEKEFIHKNTPWERSARVPLVIAGPGMAVGIEVEQPVSLVDLYPTFIDFAGLPETPHPHLPLDGHSLRPLLEKGDAGQWPGPNLAVTVIGSRDLGNHRTPMPGIDHPEAHIYSARSTDFRYIICPDGSQELYYHPSDPHEWRNLAHDPEYAPVMERLRAELEDLVGVPLGHFYEPNSFVPREPDICDKKTH